MPSAILLCLLASSHPQGPIEITSGLAIGGVSTGGRAPVGVDAVQDRIVRGSWQKPHETDALQGPRGEQRWHVATADKDGWLSDPAFGGGYFFTEFEAPKNGPMILEATGHTLVYINGVLRTGDPYGYGYLRIPFSAKQGQNELLFACGRGRIRVRVLPATQPVSLHPADLTLPDVVEADSKTLAGAIVVVNATESPIKDLTIRSSGSRTLSRTVPEIPPLGIRKVRFDVAPPPKLSGAELKVTLDLLQRGRAIDSKVVVLRIRKPNQTYRRTFVSGIDGSVQYYAVVPAQKPSRANALALTLHGASVEAQGQADAYAAKDWISIVAATNRRPFGFDWEDWGRLDALEVLNLAKQEIPHDPARVHLTGHSMGGHGTWSVGSLYPDRFASIAPSAGWVSFWSYAGGFQPRDPSPMDRLLLRSMSASDTLARVRNTLSEAVYVLHGDADDNVPVAQARSMKQALEPIHKDFQYHEQPGAGHWWGNECVDWPPIFDMMKSRRLDSRPGHIEFWTPNPAVSPNDAWLTIEQQIEPLTPSSVVADVDPSGAVTIKTTNVARFRVDSKRVDPRRVAAIDGRRLTTGSESRGASESFELSSGAWRATAASVLDQKNPSRSGPFKQAFDRRFILVYGTQGTDAETEWARNKARYDAESFYYRGNGSVDVVADRELNFRATADRNVILYGNEATNSAWSKLLRDCPIKVRRGAIEAGSRKLSGDDLAALFLYPKAGSRSALVGVVAGTGLIGMKTTDRLPYFTSGVAYPDWTILGPDIYARGTAGIKGAGFFDNRWSLGGDAVWN